MINSILKTWHLKCSSHVSTIPESMSPRGRIFQLRSDKTGYFTKKPIKKQRRKFYEKNSLKKNLENMWWLTRFEICNKILKKFHNYAL